MPTQLTDSARKHASNNLSRQIAQYSLAAAAAGVSTLALSQPADAKVVITNKNIPIPFCFALFPCSVSLDLNGDGVNDLKFSLISSYTYSAHSLHLHVAAHNGGGVVGTAGGEGTVRYASPLLRGANIGASGPLFRRKDNLEVLIAITTGHQRTLTEALRQMGRESPKPLSRGEIQDQRQNSFRMGADNGEYTVPSCVPLCSTFLSATITEYGYETVANKGLGAGLASDSADDQAQATPDKPRHPSLGMLALGRMVWRFGGARKNWFTNTISAFIR